MTDSTNNLKVKCPQCGLLTLYTKENSFRPFCSERCRLIDLGEWASESYRIPVTGPSSDSLSSDEDDYDDSSSSKH